METQDTSAVIENPTATATAEANAAPADAAKAAPKPRAPKLVATINGTEKPVLKYPFPVKAAQFDITVNGAPAKAAVTAGRGKGYTYMLVNNTSFYIDGHIDAGTAVSINFPEGYKFDDATAERKSYYKPKKAAKAEGAAEAPATGGEPAPAPTEPQPSATTEEQPAADAPKAKRRK